MKLQKKIGILCVGALIYAGLFYSAGRIGINISPSVPFTTYLINNSKENIKKGDYVLFREQADPLGILPDDAKLVKKIACISGSNLTSDKNAFYCDGVLVAVRNNTEKMTFSFNGKMPAGKYFVTGEHQRSYDSRIWGLLDENNIISTVRPLF